MKNPEISQDKKYPRFFVIFDEGKLKEYPVWHKISYVIVDGPGEEYKHFYKNGGVGNRKNWRGLEIECDRAVSDGIWREIPIEEAVLL